MEKKSTKLILGMALLLVWGLFGMRLFNRKAKTYVPVNAITEEKDIPTQSRDSFVLLADYVDPFLGRKSRNFTTSAKITSPPKNSKKSTKKVPKTVAKKQPVFPKMEYKGKVKVKHGMAKAIVKVDNQLVHWQPGARNQEMILEQIFEDSIRVRLEDVVMVVTKAR